MIQKAIWDIDAVLQRQGVLLIKLWLQAAKRSGVSKETSKEILSQATSGDYLHLVKVLQEYSQVDFQVTHLYQENKRIDEGE